MCPLFKPETDPLFGHKHGSFIQTKDSSMGPWFKLVTQAWVLYSDQGPKHGSFALGSMFISFPQFYASQHLRNCGPMLSIPTNCGPMLSIPTNCRPMLSIAYKLRPHVDIALKMYIVNLGCILMNFLSWYDMSHCFLLSP